MSDSGFTTAVPQPTFGPTGFVAPTEDAILTGVQTDINTAFGGGVNPQLSTPQGQIATTETAIIGDSNAQFLYFINGVDPAYNSGRMQDGIGRIYFMSRIAAAPTTQACVCTGLATTPIPVGALAADPDTNLLWICIAGGVIGSGGTVTLDFSCVANGPIAGPSTLTIYQLIPGWESISPSGAAVLGNNVETPSQFEARRRASVAANALQILDSIQGQVLALAGVLDCYCFENTSPYIITNTGGVFIGPNSIYICVLGGSSAAIAQTIWSKKGPGCGYSGNVSTTVTDPNPAYNPPAPSYTVLYQSPAIVSFVAVVTIAKNSGVPPNAASLVQQAIINAFNGLDGGSRAKIGSLVLASRYYGGVALLGSWAQVIEIQIGVLASGAMFTGSVGTVGSTPVLTVAAIAAGALAPGQLLQDAGPTLLPGTVIVAQLTGPTGGVGTYSLNQLQSVSSEAMTASTLLNDVKMNIAQAPAISAANINLILQ